MFYCVSRTGEEGRPGATGVRENHVHPGHSVGGEPSVLPTLHPLEDPKTGPIHSHVRPSLILLVQGSVYLTQCR